MEISVSDSAPSTATPPQSITTTLCSYAEGAHPNPELARVCDNEVTGRHVNIQLTGVSEVLSVCEVYIYGAYLPSPPPR